MTIMLICLPSHCHHATGIRLRYPPVEKSLIENIIYETVKSGIMLIMFPIPVYNKIASFDNEAFFILLILNKSHLAN